MHSEAPTAASSPSQHNTLPARKFSIAPMMGCTDMHCRAFHRVLSKNSWLYTEMVTTGALIYGNRDRYLRYNDQEHPLALQLGGSDPKALAECCRMAEDYGYDEINLNVGCPSDRVQNNMIGACLMAEPDLVSKCLETMQQATSKPVTIKHRLGIDDMEHYEELTDFIERVRPSGCKTFIIHARKALLQGLSPKQNRDIPPLNYDWVYQVKRDFPELEVIINGGITNLDESLEHLKWVDGVMLGREAYSNPYLLADVDHLIYQDQSSTTPISRLEAISRFYPYIEEQLEQGCYLSHITRHLMGLFHGQPGGKQFRRYLSENAHKPGSSIDVLKQAVSLVRH